MGLMTMMDEATKMLLEELRQIREMLRQRSDRTEVIQVDTAEAARILCVCEKTLLRWTAEGKIRRFKEGGVHRYLLEDLKAYARERSQTEALQEA